MYYLERYTVTSISPCIKFHRSSLPPPPFLSPPSHLPSFSRIHFVHVHFSARYVPTEAGSLLSSSSLFSERGR